MSVNSTAYCQRINIPLEQKIEVVSTLQSYKPIIKELDLTNQLLLSCKELNSIYSQQIDLKDSQISDYKAQISNFNEQKDLLATQIKKERLKGYVTAGVGIIGVIVAILVK